MSSGLGGAGEMSSGLMSGFVEQSRLPTAG